VTNAALERIAALPKLTDLSIHGTALTAKALAEFRQRRPEVRVFATGEAMLGALANAAGPCVLVGVEPNSAAAEADLLAGDVLVALDGSPIRDLSDLTIALFEKKAGDTVSLELMRGGQRRTVSIALKPRAF
jgi:S1-C subfamily serine protease